MSWQWTYIERTLNMQWTRHRTLRKLRERANRWKSKENSIFVLFSENHNQLHRFAAICSFLDCVQCVFNVAFTVCSLYVQCQLPPETYPYKRPYTCVTLSDPTYPMLSRHTTYLHTPDWPGLFPAYLSLCAGAWSMVACSEWVCWMWMWPAGRKQKEMLFRDGTLSKVLSLQKLQRQSCKGGIQNTACYASHAFLHRPHTFYDRYHALAMSWQWTYIERTLNMQWTRHRTLRKLRERANRWKSKENSIFVLFSENHNQLHRFAAICSFLDCVQCVFNVAFTVCSMSASTRNLPLQETIHLCNPVRPNLSHALQTHNIPSHSGLTWPIPCILIPLRRCVKHGRVQWVGVLDVNVACGPETKRNAFPRRLMDEILHQHLEIELGQISASPLPPSSMLGVFCHWGGAGFWSFNFFFSDNQTVPQC